MAVPKTMPKHPEIKFDESPKCSWEARREERERVREYLRERGLCLKMTSERGLEKVLSLAGQKGEP